MEYIIQYDFENSETGYEYDDHGRTLGELVRCRDCKYCNTFYHGEKSRLGMFTYECTRLNLPADLQGDDYCSRAERREK